MRDNTKKALCIALAVMLGIFMMPESAMAYDSFNTYISTVTEITEGQTFTVTFSFSSSYAISGINADIDYDPSMLQMVGGEVTGGFSGNVGSSIIAYTTGSSTGGAFASVTFRATSSFRPGDDTYVGLYNVTGTSDDLEDVNGYSCGVDISMSATPVWDDQGQGNYPKPEEATTIKASDSSLSSLSVEGLSLTPAFSSDVTSYSLEIPFSVESINISATANDPKATIAGTGNIPFQPGQSSVCKVVVTAQNGSTTTYEIKAARAATASTDCCLADLKVAGYTLAPLFDPDVFKYVIVAGDSLKQADITAVPAHPMANVKVLGSSDVYPGKENVYNVVCTAEDGITTRIYAITVITAQDYEFFLKKSFILTATKQLDSSEAGVVLDLSAAPVQIVPAEIFRHLASKGSGCVVIKTKNGALSFDATGLYEDREKDSYDLTIQLNSEHAAKATPSMAKYDNFVFSTNDTQFPGTAVISLYTTFIAGQNVNVYIYEPSNDKFEYASGDITVAEGGVVSFEIDRGGEFIVSTMDASQSDKYTAAVRRKISLLGTSGLILGGIGLLLGLILGLSIGTLIAGRKKKKDQVDPAPDPELPPRDPAPSDEPLKAPEEDTQEGSDEVRVAPPDEAMLMEEAVIMDDEPAGSVPQEEPMMPGDVYYEDLSALDDGMSSVDEMSERVWNEVLTQPEDEPVPGDVPDMPGTEEIVYGTAAGMWEEEETGAVLPEEDIPEEDLPGQDPAPEEAPGEERTSPEEDVLKEDEPEEPTEEGPGKIPEAPSAPDGNDPVPPEEGPKKRGLFSFRRKKQEEDEAISEFEALLDEMNKGRH